MRISIHHILSLLRESIRQKDVEAARFVYSLSLEENGFLLNPKLLCFLIKAFSSCGNLLEASKVFACNERNVYTWSAIILAHAQHGESHNALHLYKQMKLSSITPNIHTYMGVLKACSNVDSLDQVYDDLIKEGLERDQYVGNMLINVYARHGDIKKSRKVFDELYVRDIVAWSAMITAYVNHDQGQEAISLFHEMWRERPEPDDVTLLCTLKACANVGCVSHGMFIYTEITKWFQLDVYIGSAIIDMYAKCSHMEDAQKVFDGLNGDDVAAWNALIGVFYQHGHIEDVISILKHMQMEGVDPDEVTFFNVLSACSHCGLLDEGFQYFFMYYSYNVMPCIEHFNCLIGLLGRAGRLDEAEEIIHNMPFAKTASSWMGLLACCNMHLDGIRGKQLADVVFQLEPDNAASYVTLANIYAMGD